MHSRPKAAAVIGSLAITATLLLAGCGGSSTADTPSAAATWNPPRPTGIPDANWADYGKDPATLTPEQLANACSENKQPLTPELIDTVVGIHPGSTAEEWTAYADYVFAYLTPLCANLPSGAAAAPTEPSAEASAEGDAAASDMASEETASGAFPPVVDGDVSYQAWSDGGNYVDLYITNMGDAPVSTVGYFSNGLFDTTLDGAWVIFDASECTESEIPVGGYIVCSLSAFPKTGTFATINVRSISSMVGIDVPVNSTDSVPPPS
jgi:hypothetical protein